MVQVSADSVFISQFASILITQTNEKNVTFKLCKRSSSIFPDQAEEGGCKTFLRYFTLMGGQVSKFIRFALVQLKPSIRCTELYFTTCHLQHAWFSLDASIKHKHRKGLKKKRTGFSFEISFILCILFYFGLNSYVYATYVALYTACFF